MNWNQIVETANSPESLLWSKGVALINWADKNASPEEKSDFVEWVEGDWSNVTDRMPQADPEEFFEGAPEWDEL